MPFVTGTLTDFGLDPLAVNDPVLIFRASSTGLAGANLLSARKAVEIVPDTSGLFTVDLVSTDEIAPADTHYIVEIRYRETETRQRVHEVLPWKLLVPPAGGLLADLLRVPSNPALVWTGEAAPENTTPGTWWLDPSTGDLSEHDGQGWTFKANLRGPIGLAATGAAEDDAAVAAFLSTPGTATADALTEAVDAQIDEAAGGYDLIVTLGQSNTAGRGTPYSSTTDPAHPLIYQFGAKARAIVPATEPLDNNEASTSGIGPAFQFARHYVANAMNAGRKVLIVPTAKGGTKLVGTTGDTWNSTIGGNLYAAMVTQAQQALAAAGPGSRIVGFIFVQGESDGDENRTGAEYQAALDALITKLRTDLAAPMVPFVIGGMVPDYLGTGTRAQINTVHKDTPFRKLWTTFAAPPAGAAYNLGDGNHFNAAGQRIIGKTMFDAWARAYAGLSSLDAAAAPGFVDSFNRADIVTGTSLGMTDNGKPWTNLDTGTWRILSNQARTTVGDPSYGGDTYTVVDGGSANGTLETVMTAGNRAGGIAFRVQDRANLFSLSFRFNSSNFTLTLFKWTAGVKSTVSTSTVTLAYGDVLTVELNGPSIIVKVNGTAAITVTDAAFQTATKCGLYGNTSGTDVRWDYLKFTAA